MFLWLKSLTCKGLLGEHRLERTTNLCFVRKMDALCLKLCDWQEKDLDTKDFCASLPTECCRRPALCRYSKMQSLSQHPPQQHAMDSNLCSMSTRCPYFCSSTEKARAGHLSGTASTGRRRLSPRCVSSLSTVPDTSLQRRQTTSTGYPAGPEDPQPNYHDIDSAPLNKAVMSLFRRWAVHLLCSCSLSDSCSDN